MLVDDAEAIDDVGGVLDRLSTSDRPDLLFVAAGRNDGIRAGYSHWTRPLRRSKLGVLLRPDIDLDGDILGVTAAAPGAGGDGRRAAATWPAGGEAELVQVARAALTGDGRPRCRRAGRWSLVSSPRASRRRRAGLLGPAESDF